eukprot:2138715-Amphidinium_carterae.1
MWTKTNLKLRSAAQELGSGSFEVSELLETLLRACSWSAQLNGLWCCTVATLLYSIGVAAPERRQILAWLGGTVLADCDIYRRLAVSKVCSAEVKINICCIDGGCSLL